MIARGMDPEYLLNLDLLSFNALAESFQTVHDLDRYDHAWLTALAFHDTKVLAEQLNEHRKGAGVGVLTGDDLVAQIGGGM